MFVASKKPQKLPDITLQGATWSVSSSKQGLGVTHLHDNQTATYWQSDGQQPHHACAHYTSRQAIYQISLYLDVDQDESYTPCKVSILSGTSLHDLQLTKEVEFASDPRGWVDISMTDEEEAGEQHQLMAHFVKLQFPLNYENGRDVRVRQIRIYGPPKGDQIYRKDNMLPFTSNEFLMYENIR